VLLVLIGLLMVTGVWTRLMYALQAVMTGYDAPL
jgi:cytochrome c-type biogenesis protein